MPMPPKAGEPKSPRVSILESGQAQTVGAEEALRRIDERLRR
jgi:hypothetical protein